ncbi:MAG: hypothetical protein WDN28_08680 [Chthoniobacter sp.]
MKYRTYLIFGAPGSGKGTQGKILGAIPRFFFTALAATCFASSTPARRWARPSWNTPAAGNLCRTKSP